MWNPFIHRIGIMTARNHEVSSSVPSYPVHFTRYSNLHFLHLSILELRISETSYWFFINKDQRIWRFNTVWKLFGVEGSSIEMWKTGWIDQRCSGSQRVKEMVLTWAIIGKGPEILSESFFEGRVVWILLDWTKALSPILKSRVSRIDFGRYSRLKHI